MTPTTIPVSHDDLEQLAWDTRRPIMFHGNEATLTHAGVTYLAILTDAARP